MFDRVDSSDALGLAAYTTMRADTLTHNNDALMAELEMLALNPDASCGGGLGAAPAGRLCTICMDLPPSTHNAHRFACAHGMQHGSLLCGKCAGLCSSCPICRAPVTGDSAPAAALADTCEIPALPGIDEIDVSWTDLLADTPGASFTSGCTASSLPSSDLELDALVGTFSADETEYESEGRSPSPSPQRLSSPTQYTQQGIILSPPSPTESLRVTSRRVASRRSKTTATTASPYYRSASKAQKKPAKLSEAAKAKQERFRGKPAEQGGLEDEQICDTPIKILRDMIRHLPEATQERILERRKLLQNRLHARKAAAKREQKHKGNVQLNGQLAETCERLTTENHALRKANAEYENHLRRAEAERASSLAQMNELHQELASLRAQLARQTK